MKRTECSGRRGEVHNGHQAKIVLWTCKSVGQCASILKLVAFCAAEFSVDVAHSSL